MFKLVGYINGTCKYQNILYEVGLQHKTYLKDEFSQIQVNPLLSYRAFQ